ncbi:hypothetical protein M758_3G049500 [Ceratodon purpureus]|nr:hypothetical protein M758_3G049500 [Ceratodon purpureus]
MLQTCLSLTLISSLVNVWPKCSKGSKVHWIHDEGCHARGNSLLASKASLSRGGPFVAPANLIHDCYVTLSLRL